MAGHMPAARVDSEAKAEISTAINKVLLAQIAVAGLLFAALKLF